MHLNGYGKSVTSIFGLLGKKENDITKSLSYVFSKCKIFISIFLNHYLSECNYYDLDDVVVSFQERHDDGITDIEIYQPGLFFLIIEAKIRFNMPSINQLQKYANFLSVGNFKYKKIITMSCIEQEIAKTINPPQLCGIVINHASYSTIYKMANDSIANSKNKGYIEKLINVGE